MSNKKRRVDEDHVEHITEMDLSSCDSNSSWEIDLDQTIVTEPTQAEAGNAAGQYHLPAELEGGAHAEEPDYNSEDDDDHTGEWREGDLDTLVLALNHYRSSLKGKFYGSAGGKKKRDKAWDDLVDYVNQRCNVRWTKAQIKGKARRYAKVVKDKYNTLRREIFKTGGGEIDDEKYLTQREESMLDYIGVDGVVGLPGMHGTSLNPKQGRRYRRKVTEAATSAWDPKRESRQSYLTLPQDKLKLAPKSKK